MNADELRARMVALPEPPTDSRPPFWDYWRHDLWSRVVSGEDPFGFPTWPCVYHTMLVNHWKEYIQVEFDYLCANLTKWGGAILANGPEEPKDYYIGAFGYELAYSSNLIHQSYHLSRWEATTDKHVRECNKIIEVGGGYGAMAAVIHCLGFKGEYHIFDQAEFSLLQQFYLTNCGIDTVEYNNPRKRKVADLLIGCYSLSEMDVAQRTRILTRHKADSYLFLYSNKFAEYDNLTYFHNDAPVLATGQWEHSLIEHLPPESWYSFGWQHV